MRIKIINMNPIKYQKFKNGVSLTEILIAFAVFILAVIPFINILMYSTRANIKSINAIKAATLALSMCEQLKFGSSVIEVPPFKATYQGYYSLQYLIVTASPGGEGTNWQPYTKTIDYGKIIGYPRHKLEIEVAFYPVKTFPKKSFPPMIFDSTTPPKPVSNPKEQPEYQKLMSRIQINVTVKWFEPDNPNKEFEYKAFTIVTKP